VLICFGVFMACTISGQPENNLICAESLQTYGDRGRLGNGWLSNILYILATVVKSAEEGSDELFVSL